MVYVRKLVKAGQTSHTLSLPKEWLDKNNLKKGDAVYLYEKSSTEIIITPHIKRSKPVAREITLSFEKSKAFETLQREITSAYINNYHTINIVGEQVKKNQQELRELLRDFVALELIEQSSNSFTARDLLNIDDVSIEKTIRRIDMILRSMFQDISKDTAQESLSFRDQDVNRLYFLVFRMLKGSLKDDTLAEQFKILPARILSLWYLAVNLENIADCCKNIYPLIKEKQNSVQLFLKNISEHYEALMKSFYTKDKHFADNFAKQRTIIMQEVDQLPNETHEHFKQVITLLNNIARIIIDDE
ncbi:phosphate uptake regulator PhoU [Candidatus Woesearchaeota archaeon]|nr:phosphate uptake regulator PhoU [Candidatus Woesearchaeota archaeon]